MLAVSVANRGGEGYTGMDTKNNCREVGKDFPTVGVFQFVCFDD